MVNEHWGKPPIEDEYDWLPLRVNSLGIVVKWQEKYGPERSEECIGLWENKDKYRLTFRDEKFIELEKSNVNSIAAEAIHK